MPRCDLSHRRLYLLFTPSLCAGDPTDTLRAAITAGVDLVQWRVPAVASSPAHTEEDAARAAAVCRAANVPLIVNDDLDLAVAIDADGAHVGQDDTPASEARQRIGTERILGVSTHNRQQVLDALRNGADHLGFGPMFPTTTKGYTEGQQEGALQEALRAARVPLYPIGGITPDNVGAVLAQGADRIAVSSCILGAADPGAVVRALRRALDTHRAG